MEIDLVLDIGLAYNLRDLVMFLVFLAGAGMGVFLLSRKRRLPGILTIAAFLLFSLEPLLDVIVFRLLFQQDLSEQAFQTLDYIYPCITAPAFFLGSLALIIALYLLVKPEAKPPEHITYPG